MNDPIYYLQQLTKHWTTGFYTGLAIGIGFTSVISFFISIYYLNLLK